MPDFGRDLLKSHETGSHNYPQASCPAASSPGFMPTRPASTKACIERSFLGILCAAQGDCRIKHGASHYAPAQSDPLGHGLARCGSKATLRGGMLDTIIRGGNVVTPEGVHQCDVAISGEIIAAVTAPGALSSELAGRVIDASGRVVMPGGIDPHVHLHHVWIKPDGTALTTAGPEQVGRAALFGGTTTFIDFAYWRDSASAREAIEARDQDFVGKSPCDWAYHIMLHSEPPPQFADQLAEAIQAGYPTLKIFTTNILPSRSGRMIDFGDIWEAFQILAREGGLGVIHAEDNDIVMHMYAKLIREGRV